MSFETTSRRSEAEKLLRKHWKHHDFRPGQWEIIETILDGQDVLAILPTGGGKSICYQLPAIMQGGLTLVVSPLISLMQDQVAGLRARRIAAAFINSTLSAREIDQRWTDAEYGRYRLLYVSPERLQTEVFQARVSRLPVKRIVVDEAHCISEWGRHFRPAYREIARARELLGNPPVAAFTATATPLVRRDIVEMLELKAPVQVATGFDRPNITWSIFRTPSKRQKVVEILRNVKGSGIVYTATRKSAEEWASWLASQGETVEVYHGGLGAETRASVQEAWLKGEKRIIVATNAFGMGIDKPDVRFVIHVEMPGSVEAYYQEAGRAGRDGKKAFAVLLYQHEDTRTQRHLLESGHPEARSVRIVYDAVCSVAQVPIGALPNGPVTIRYEVLQKVTGFSKGKLVRAVEILSRQKTWQVLPLKKYTGLLRFDQPVERIREYVDKTGNRALARFVTELLRVVHADAFLGWWELDLRLLQRRMRIDRMRLSRGLAFLASRELLSWQPPGTAFRVVFNHARAQRLPVDDLLVQKSFRRAERHFLDMLRYARSVTCRRQFLLAYFGEEIKPPCGKCDVCLGRHRGMTIQADDEPILRSLLRQIELGVTGREWVGLEGVPEDRIDYLVDYLFQEAYISVRHPLEETFVLEEKGRQWLTGWEPSEG